jgi:hypothetical protein
MPANIDREIQFQSEFYFFLKKTIESKLEIKGFKFSKVEMEYPINGGKADIVLFDEHMLSPLSNFTPFYP